MRYENWPELLDGCLRKWALIPFVREKTDCVEFAIDVIAVMTGRVIENPERGNYTTEQDAARCILRHGANLATVVTQYLGAPIPITFAQRGDIVIRGNNLGVCVGVDSVFRSIVGTGMVPTLKCEQAWRVD